MDTSRFGSIECNWKISSNADTTRSFIIRLATDTDPQLDYHASELNLAPVLNPLTLRVESKANLNQKDSMHTSNDSCSFLEYSSWFSPSSTLNRTMLLAAEEGVLLVQDYFDANEATASASLNVGPVWHFSPSNTPLVRNATDTETAWVMSKGAKVNLFVAIDIKSGSRSAVVDKQTVDVWSKADQQSAFGRVTLEKSSAGGGQVRAVSLLVPCKPTDIVDGHDRSFVTSIIQRSDGGEVAAMVSWPTSMCTGSSYCGTSLELRLGAQGGQQWNITRKKSE